MPELLHNCQFRYVDVRGALTSEVALHSLRHPKGVHCLTTARNSWYVLASVYGGDDGCVGTEGGEVAVLLREELGAVAAVD